MRGDQLAAVTSATNRKNRDLSGLTLLTSRGGDHDGYAAGPSEPFGGNLLIAPVSDLSAKWAELQSRIPSEQETLRRLLGQVIANLDRFHTGAEEGAA